jgi:rhodanese-related sulfurtransferase
MSAIQTTSIDVNELREMLERLEPVVLLDIRPTADWEEWHIPGSLHVDVYQALRAGDEAALADVDLDPSTPIVTLCGVGKVSQRAAEQLRARGFDARSLAGGMKAWSLAWNTADMLVPGSNARVVQVRRAGKGCLSYVIYSGREAVVIDASVAPEVYLELVAGRGWTITHVLDTHVHADHIRRSRALSDLSGARLQLPATQRVA